MYTKSALLTSHFTSFQFKKKTGYRWTDGQTDGRTEEKTGSLVGERDDYRGEGDEFFLPF